MNFEAPELDFNKKLTLELFFRETVASQTSKFHLKYSVRYAMFATGYRYEN